jgi:hypothetical protein
MNYRTLAGAVLALLAAAGARGGAASPGLAPGTWHLTVSGPASLRIRHLIEVPPGGTSGAQGYAFIGLSHGEAGAILKQAETGSVTFSPMRSINSRIWRTTYALSTGASGPKVTVATAEPVFDQREHRLNQSEPGGFRPAELADRIAESSVTTRQLAEGVFAGASSGVTWENGADNGPMPAWLWREGARSEPLAWKPGVPQLRSPFGSASHTYQVRLPASIAGRRRLPGVFTISFGGHAVTGAAWAERQGYAQISIKPRSRLWQDVLDAVDGCVIDLEAAGDIDFRRSILTGFSRAGTAAGDAFTNHQHLFGGLLMIGAADGFREFSGIGHPTGPIAYLCGQKDPVFQRVVESTLFHDGAGRKNELFTHPGAHTIGGDALVGKALDWLKGEIARGESGRPAPASPAARTVRLPGPPPATAAGVGPAAGAVEPGTTDAGQRPWEADEASESGLIPFFRQLHPAYQDDPNRSGVEFSPSGHEHGDSLWAEAETDYGVGPNRITAVKARVGVADEACLEQFSRFLTALFGITPEQLRTLKPYRPVELKGQGLADVFLTAELNVGKGVDGRHYWIRALPRSASVVFSQAPRTRFVGFAAIRKALQAGTLREAAAALGGVDQLSVQENRLFLSFAHGTDGRAGREEGFTLQCRIDPKTGQTHLEGCPAYGFRPGYADVLKVLNTGLKTPGKLVPQGKPFSVGGPKTRHTLRGFPVEGVAILEYKKKMRGVAYYVKVNLPSGGRVYRCGTSVRGGVVHPARGRSTVRASSPSRRTKGRPDLTWL